MLGSLSVRLELNRMGIGRHPLTPPYTLPKPKYMSVPEGLANKMHMP